MPNIKELAAELDEVQNQIAIAEGALSELKEQERHLTMNLIPALMEDMGICELVMDNGDKIATTNILTAGFISDSKIAKEKDDNKRMDMQIQQQQQIDWMQKTGNESLIKNKLSVDFDSGEDKIAEEIKEKLIEAGLPAHMQKDIHNRTLTAFFKRKLEDNEDNDIDSDAFEIFNIKEIPIAKVKKAKN